MIKPILHISLCFAIAQCAAQNYPVRFDADHYQHQITFSDHYLSFQLQPSGSYVKNTAIEKKYYWYSNNQLKITEGSYSGKLLHGRYNDFYFNQNLKEQGEFEMGLKVGEWKKWTLQGLLLESISFRKGVLHGPFLKYDGLGKLLERGHYKRGKIEGKLIRYFDQDSVALIRYKKGQIKITRNTWLKKLIQ